MTIRTTKLTYQDYLLLPEDGKRYEILDGELYMTPAPSTRHQTISSRLNYVFIAYLEIHPVGTMLAAPCDIVLSEGDIVQPDLLFVHKEGLARITERNVQGPPDLIVEILSPGTAARDRELKRKRYEYFGVREYWLVDPDQNTLELLQLKEGRLQLASKAARPAQLSSPMLPGHILDLGWILK